MDKKEKQPFSVKSFFAAVWGIIKRFVAAPMFKTIVRRFLILIPQLIALSLLIFILASIMPGDALRGIITPDMPQALIDQLRLQHGLDDSWYVQYWNWISGIILEGDFGRSIANNSIPVIDIIGDRIHNTVRLSMLTTFFTYLLAIPLGLLAGRKNGKPVDKVIMIYTFIALSMPTVVLSVVHLLLYGFGVTFEVFGSVINTGIFPITGSIDPRAAGVGGLTAIMSRLHHLFLPAITLALISTTGIIYFLRSEIVDYETSDFVLTARAKGVPEGKIYTGHILRNAFLPVAGGMGTIIVTLFSGSIFIETVFSYPGMGQLFISSITGRDFPVVNVLVMFFAILSAVSMLISDIIISIIDPRIRIK